MAGVGGGGGGGGGGGQGEVEGVAEILLTFPLNRSMLLLQCALAASIHHDNCSLGEQMLNGCN